MITTNKIAITSENPIIIYTLTSLLLLDYLVNNLVSLNVSVIVELADWIVVLLEL